MKNHKKIINYRKIFQMHHHILISLPHLFSPHRNNISHRHPPPQRLPHHYYLLLTPPNTHPKHIFSIYALYLQKLNFKTSSRPLRLFLYVYSIISSTNTNFILLEHLSYLTKGYSGLCKMNLSQGTFAKGYSFFR